MEAHEIELPYTQADRDMIRDTHGDVKRILKNQDKHDQRISHLETWHTRVSAITGFVGLFAGVAVREVSRRLFHWS